MPKNKSTNHSKACLDSTCSAGISRRILVEKKLNSSKKASIKKGLKKKNNNPLDNLDFFQVENTSTPFPALFFLPEPQPTQPVVSKLAQTDITYSLSTIIFFSSLFGIVIAFLLIFLSIFCYCCIWRRCNRRKTTNCSLVKRQPETPDTANPTHSGTSTTIPDTTPSELDTTTPTKNSIYFQTDHKSTYFTVHDFNKDLNEREISEEKIVLKNNKEKDTKHIVKRKIQSVSKSPSVIFVKSVKGTSTENEKPLPRSKTCEITLD